MTKDAFKSAKPGEDVFVLVAGDSDFVPAIRTIRDEAYKVEVVFWNHASRELRQTANTFVGLDDFLKYLRI